MPELPEVETIVKDLNKFVLGRKIEGVWSDWKKIVKKPSFNIFQKEIIGKKIQKIHRRGKNIIFELSNGKVLLAHQKMTGHFLFGKWKLLNGKWVSQIPGPLKDDSMNQFLHFIFFLDNGFQLALSDIRKFAKMELWDFKDFHLNHLGPEPLLKDFTFIVFKEVFSKKTKNGKINNTKIKQALMDQAKVAGIGNIYADEILWEAQVNPETKIAELNEKQLRSIFTAIKKILKKSLKLGGTSISDFRKLSGEKGRFAETRKAYKRKGEPCARCNNKIKRIVVAQRGTYFCPKCQAL